MSLQTIYIIIAIVSTLIGTTIPAIIAFVKSVKKHRVAKTEAEKEAAKNEMMTAVNSFIVSAESMYKGVDKIMKAQGQSTGELKKESVMTKLQSFALANGYEFDKEYWSKTVDDIVDLTKQVNAKEDTAAGTLTKL